MSQLVAQMPVAAALGVQIDQASNDEVRGRLDWTAERCTADGVMHGGALMTLADSLGAICAYLNLPEGASTATIESKTNFFAPLAAGHVHGVSRALHKGRRTIVVDTELRDDAGKLLARVTQTQAVL
jgi:uncharacterized protein (TIGR00369 family)